MLYGDERAWQLITNPRVLLTNCNDSLLDVAVEAAVY